MLHLIALDKCLGVQVRPIGIGETLQYVVGKTSCFVRVHVEFTCGSDQLCSSVKLGVDSASGWGVLLVDAFS